jgi:hypothetical protein
LRPAILLQGAAAAGRRQLNRGLSADEHHHEIIYTLDGTHTGKEGERTKREKEIDDQDGLITELGLFKKALEQVAALDYEPDLDDGVVLNIAPSHELTPWKEAKTYWTALLKGEYEWSTMSRRLKARGVLAP